MDAVLVRWRWPLVGLLVIAGWGLANAPLRPEVWYLSALAILLFSAPVIVGAISWLGPGRGLGLLAGLGAYALIVESFAVATGVPYGRFSYSQILGPPLFGLAPPTVLLAWTPLLLGCLALTSRPWLAVALLVVVDLVLDPAAVRLGFWRWDEPGVYYGVPLVNFLGWIVSGCIAVLALRRLPRPIPRLFARNLWLVLVFWTAVNAWNAQWLPALIGVALLAASAPHYGRGDDQGIRDSNRDRRRPRRPRDRRPARAPRPLGDAPGEERAARRTGESLRD